MKDNSCIICGHELEVIKKCDICHKVNQFHCHESGYVTEKQIHFQCMMTSIDHTLIAN